MADSNIEEQLRVWQEKLNTISHNLMDLVESPTTSIVRAGLKNPQNPYRGRTAQVAQKAMNSLDALCQDYLLLVAVLDKANDLHKRSHLFKDNSQEVLQLLNGNSVAKPQVYIPLQNRGLLDSANHQDLISLSAALGAMQNEFIQARDQISQIILAQNNAQARMDQISSEFKSLNTIAEQLGLKLNELNNIQTAMQQFCTDPLDGMSLLDQSVQLLNQQRQLLQIQQEEFNSTKIKIGQAAQKLVDLQTMIQSSKLAFEQCQKQILQPQGLMEPLQLQQIEALQTWFKTLQEHWNMNQWRAVKIGLGKWLTDCDLFLAKAEENLNHNRTPLDRWMDLRGRFKATSAKFQSLSLRGFQASATLLSLIQSCQVTLEHLPVDLNLAQNQIQDFESQLYTQSQPFIALAKAP